MFQVTIVYFYLYINKLFLDYQKSHYIVTVFLMSERVVVVFLLSGRFRSLNLTYIPKEFGPLFIT